MVCWMILTSKQNKTRCCFVNLSEIVWSFRENDDDYQKLFNKLSSQLELDTINVMRRMDNNNNNKKTTHQKKQFMNEMRTQNVVWIMDLVSFIKNKFKFFALQLTTLLVMDTITTQKKSAEPRVII